MSSVVRDGIVPDLTATTRWPPVSPGLSLHITSGCPPYTPRADDEDPHHMMETLVREPPELRQDRGGVGPRVGGLAKGHPGNVMEGCQRGPHQLPAPSRVLEPARTDLRESLLNI